MDPLLPPNRTSGASQSAWSTQQNTGEAPTHARGHSAQQSGAHADGPPQRHSSSGSSGAMAARVAATALRMQSRLQNAGERAEQVEQNTGSRRLRRVAGAAAGLLRGTARFASQVAEVAAQQAVPAPTAPSTATHRADSRPATTAASSGSQQQPARPAAPRPSAADHPANVNTAQSSQAASPTASTAPRQPGTSSASASTHRAQSRSSNAANTLADRESNPELYDRQTTVGAFFKSLSEPHKFDEYFGATYYPTMSKEEEISRIKKIADNPELVLRMNSVFCRTMSMSRTPFLEEGAENTLENMDLRIAILEAIHDLPYISNQMTKHNGKYFSNPPDPATFADRLARIEAAAGTEETIFPEEPIPTAEMPQSLIQALVNTRIKNTELQIGLGHWSGNPESSRWFSDPRLG
jgi:hypothetical protein